MNDLAQLKPLLQRLRLNGISEIIEELLSEAVSEKWDYTKLPTYLFTKESERRDNKQNYYRLSRSGLDPTKTLEVFDFNFNKNISKVMIKELSLCNFIKQKENIFFVGHSGVGKSHLANAIGCEACRRGFDVIYKRTQNLLDWLHSGNGDSSFNKRFDMIRRVPLLILDDFGLLKMNENHQRYLFEIISERYEKTSTIITSNRDFGEWIKVFDNPLIGSAAMDRLVHKAFKISMEGESYRIINFRNKQKNIFNDKNNML
jgi:DNA replication protein DnaC